MTLSRHRQNEQATSENGFAEIATGFIGACPCSTSLSSSPFAEPHFATEPAFSSPDGRPAFASQSCATRHVAGVIQRRANTCIQ